MKQAHRRGITLFEVLLVLVLVAIGIAVAIVFVQQSRERHKLAQCAYHLKTLGEAIYFFEGTAENLKRARLTPRPGGPDSRQFLPAAPIPDAYATWAVQIAPYLSPDDVLATWDMQTTYFDQPDDVRQKTVPEFFCPARERDFRVSRGGDVRPGDPKGDNVPGALGDYACVSGDDD